MVITHFVGRNKKTSKRECGFPRRREAIVWSIILEEHVQEALETGLFFLSKSPAVDRLLAHGSIFLDADLGETSQASEAGNSPVSLFNKKV